MNIFPVRTSRSLSQTFIPLHLLRYYTCIHTAVTTTIFATSCQSCYLPRYSFLLLGLRRKIRYHTLPFLFLKRKRIPNPNIRIQYESYPPLELDLREPTVPTTHNYCPHFISYPIPPGDSTTYIHTYIHTYIRNVFKLRECLKHL